MSMRSLLRAVPMLLVLVACQDRTLTEPGDRRSVTPGLAISGVEGFAFLPPTVRKAPTLTGTFDGTLAPTVRVVCTGATGSLCPEVAAFSMGGGASGIKVDLEGEHYHLLWHTPGSLVVGRDRYRIEVVVGGAVVGQGDLWVVNSPAEERLVPATHLGVARGRPFLIKFRLVENAADGLPALEGQPTALAGPLIPRLEYVPSGEDFAADYPALAGMAISFNTMIVGIRPTATVGEVNALLQEHGARIIGGLSGPAGATGYLILRLPTRSHVEALPTVAAIQAHAAVSEAMPDIELSPTVISRPGARTPWDWRWEVFPTGGNWGMETIRAPQLWNLNRAMARLGGAVPTGVLDSDALYAHEDLSVPDGDNLSVMASDQTKSDAVSHPTHVTGIIAALHGNNRGIEGVSPFARVIYRANDGFGLRDAVFGWRSSFGALLSKDLQALMDFSPAPRVINVSLGFNWYLNGINPELVEDAQDLASRSGRLIHDFLAGRPSLPVIVASGGNGSTPSHAVSARWGSPLTNAALEHGAAPIIVVEAAVSGDQGLNRATFSGDGGHVSAPGVDIVSTDRKDGYERASGTSQAAPHVTGLVSFLLALDPGFPAPTMTTNPIRDLLQANPHDNPVGRGGRPLIDAFAAALDLDRVQGGDRILRMLLDIDDGSLDGNQRTKSDGSDFTDDLEQTAAPRDGRIDMADFRRWRDWLLQTEGSADLKLDGSPGHLKRDLNGDGVVDVTTPERENIYPRGDFNGDGLIHRSLDRAVSGLLGRQVVTDLQVFQHLFNDPDYEANELPALIDSGDLDVTPALCLQIPGAVAVEASILGADGQPPYKTRALVAGTNPRHVFTVRTNPLGHRARVEARDVTDKVLGMFEQDFAFELGSDERWDPECMMLDLTVEFPSGIRDELSHPLKVRAVKFQPRLPQQDGVPAAFATVKITPSGGTVAAPVGVTDSEGLYTTTARQSPGAYLSLRIEVDAGNGVRAAADVISCFAPAVGAFGLGSASSPAFASADQCAALEILPTTPPLGKIRHLYSHTFRLVDPVPGVTWAIVGGSLPPGIGLTAVTGEISGVPTMAGIYPLRIRASADGASDERDVEVRIAGNGGAFRLTTGGTSFARGVYTATARVSLFHEPLHGLRVEWTASATRYPAEWWPHLGQSIEGVSLVAQPPFFPDDTTAVWVATVSRPAEWDASYVNFPQYIYEIYARWCLYRLDNGLPYTYYDGFLMKDVHYCGSRGWRIGGA